MRELIVKVATKLGLYHTLVEIDTYFKRRKLKKAFSENGLNMLSIANDTFKEKGITFFPTAGTLLGVYRDKKFINGDFDLDCGVLASERPKNFVEILENVGFNLVVEIFSKETGRIVEDRFMYKGVQLDIFFYFEEGDDYYCYFARRHETKDWRQANKEDGFPTARSYAPKCGFEKAEFLGIELTIPTKTPQWLADIYGETFMTPIKNWNEFAQKTRIVYKNERVYRRLFNN